jgi:transcriptional regulator with XRE-family HTH domain
MNGYLLFLGSNISEIRQILSLTQEELAKMMGVSRPTIVKLEQDPSKMTKALAFALFGATAIEMKKRLKSVKAINPKDYKDIEKIGVLAENLKSSAALSISNMGMVAARGLGTLIPGIGSVISSGLKNGWKSVKDSAVSNLKENANWGEDKAEKIIDSVERKLHEDEKRLLEYFKLTALDIELFGEAMEKGEDSDYDLWAE